MASASTEGVASPVSVNHNEERTSTHLNASINHSFAGFNERTAGGTACLRLLIKTAWHNRRSKMPYQVHGTPLLQPQR